MGAENVNTDEYDRQVVLYEWGHYFQNNFSRDDSIGGAHSINPDDSGDALDPRVAFSEGFADLFGGMLNLDPMYVDTKGDGQANGFSANLDENGPIAFFSEQTVDGLLWDLFDDQLDPNETNAISGSPIVDNVAIGFGPVYETMRKDVKNSPAFTTIFSFLAGVLKNTDPAIRDNVIALTKAHRVDASKADEFEELDDHPRSINLTLPGDKVVTTSVGRLYTNVPTDGTEVSVFGPGTAFEGKNLKGDVSLDPSRDGNKLNEFAFFKLEVKDPGTYLITVIPTDGSAVELHVKLPHGERYAPTPPADPTPNKGQALKLTLAAGTYVATVTTKNVVNGSLVPAFGSFTIKVEKQ
jgi:hypothetical protein